MIQVEDKRNIKNIVGYYVLQMQFLTNFYVLLSDMQKSHLESVLGTGFV